MDPVATAEENKFAAAAFAEETAAAENTAAAAAADVKLIAANMESLGSTGIRSKSRTTGSIPVTLIRKDRTDDGHVEAGSVTQSFKGRSAFSFQNSADATKYETGARFLKQFKLTVKNNKNIIFRSILDPQEMMPLPESHVSAVFCMLVMLVEGPMAAIVDRYTSNSDGVAAYRALERAVEQHGSEMFLPLLKKKISDAVFPNPTEDPAAFLAMFTGWQRNLAHHTAYDIDNQIADIKLLLSTPATMNYGRLLEIAYDDVDTFVDKIANHWDCFIRIRREPDRRHVVAGIDMHEGDDNTPRRFARGRGRGRGGGRGGGGGRGAGRDGGRGGRGGVGGDGPPRVPRGPPKCWLCGSLDHKIDACPNKGAAIEHVAAVKARELEEEDEDDDYEQDSIAASLPMVSPIFLPIFLRHRMIPDFCSFCHIGRRRAGTVSSSTSGF